jgi:hypothetical protein
MVLSYLRVKNSASRFLIAGKGRNTAYRFSSPGRHERNSDCNILTTVDSTSLVTIIPATHKSILGLAHPGQGIIKTISAPPRRGPFAWNVMVLQEIPLVRA